MKGRVLRMENSRRTWGQILTNFFYHRICLDSLVEHFGFLPGYLAAPMFLSFACYVSFNTNKVAIITQQYLKVLHWTSSLGASQSPKFKRSKQFFLLGRGGGVVFYAGLLSLDLSICFSFFLFWVKLRRGYFKFLVPEILFIQLLHVLYIKPNYPKFILVQRLFFLE